MKNPLKPSRKLQDSAGYVLPLVLIIMALVFTLGTIWLKNVRYSTAMSRRYREHETALVVMESATAVCKANMTVNADYDGTDGFVSTENGRYKIGITGVKVLSQTDATNNDAAGQQNDNVSEENTENSETPETPEVVGKTVEITAVCGDAVIKRRGTATFSDGRFQRLYFAPYN